jgi:hypothetical protein
MQTISARTAKYAAAEKGEGARPLSTYRAARRNAVRAAIRKAAEAKRSFPGWD